MKARIKNVMPRITRGIVIDKSIWDGVLMNKALQTEKSGTWMTLTEGKGGRR